MNWPSFTLRYPPNNFLPGFQRFWKMVSRTIGGRPPPLVPPYLRPCVAGFKFVSRRIHYKIFDFFPVFVHLGEVEIDRLCPLRKVNPGPVWKALTIGPCILGLTILSYYFKYIPTDLKRSATVHNP